MKATIQCVFPMTGHTFNIGVRCPDDCTDDQIIQELQNHMRFPFGCKYLVKHDIPNKEDTTMTDKSLRDTYVMHLENQTKWLENILKVSTSHCFVNQDYIEALAKQVKATRKAFDEEAAFLGEEIESFTNYGEFDDVESAAYMDKLQDEYISYKMLYDEVNTLNTSIQCLEQAIQTIENYNNRIQFTNDHQRVDWQNALSTESVLAVLHKVEDSTFKEVDPSNNLCDPTKRTEKQLRKFFYTAIAGVLNSPVTVYDLTGTVLHELEDENHHLMHAACKIILHQWDVSYAVDLFTI